MLVCAVLVPAAALFFSLRQPAQYVASADVLLSRTNLGAALSGTPDSSPFVYDTGLASTQTELAQTPDVAQEALNIAHVSNISPQGLLGAVSVAKKGDTDVLQFIVRDGDPARAALLATSFAQAYIGYRSTLETKSLVNARTELNNTLAKLKADGREKSDLYTTLEEKEQQLAISQTLQTSQAFLIRRATGAAQVAPTPRRNAILGLMLGLVLGLALAFGIDALDTRVRSGAEVAQRLGLPLLARIPAPPKGFAKKDRLVMLAQPTGTGAEVFRMLRTNLDFARLQGSEVRSILVTSAIEQEGKSTTAANLAIAEARAGGRVALVDLDLRKPYLDRFFHLLDARGITDVAIGNVSLDEALVSIDLALGTRLDARAETNGHVEQGTLDVLVSGTRPPDPGEFVGTRKLQEILTELCAHYEIVIIDTPPALRVGDAMTLSSHVDGIVVVTRLNVIRRPMLSELRRLLDTAPARKLGYVVTAARQGENTGYGYGYSYGGYGYGYGDPAKAKQERGRAAGRAAAAAVEETDRV